ncbi:hypothetical protein BY458DRAFT_573734 [Sporodiniella umbellata]|nr:hypothetical protein BY458DRAFT_573734 [Sporodiniella umbellata]
MESNGSYFDERIKHFIDSAPTNHFLQHLAEHVSILAPYIYHPTASSRRFVPPLASFITLLARRSRAKSGTLLASLIIMDKLKRKLDKTRSGVLQGHMLHTVFLCCVILTTKCIHDASPKNSRWSKYAAYFSIEEINKLERRILVTMDHHLKITREDFDLALSSYHYTMYPASPMLSDRQYIPKAASLSSFPRPIGLKQSHLSSIFNHVKSSFSELRKLPSHANKAKHITDIKLPSSPKAFEFNIGSNHGMHTPETEETKGLVHSQSLLDTTIPSGDLFVSLFEHISSSSLTSNSTADNESVLTMSFENNRIDDRYNAKPISKRDLLIPSSPAGFSSTLLNDEWLKKFGERA